MNSLASVEYAHNWTGTGNYGTVTAGSGISTFSKNALRFKGSLWGSQSYAMKFTLDTTSMGNLLCFIIAPKVPTDTEAWPSIYKNASGQVILGTATKTGASTATEGDFNNSTVVAPGILYVTVIVENRSYLGYATTYIVIQDSAGKFYRTTSWGYSRYYSTTYQSLYTSNTGSGTAVVSGFNVDYNFSSGSGWYYGFGFVANDPDHVKFNVFDTVANMACQNLPNSYRNYEGYSFGPLASNSTWAPCQVDSSKSHETWYATHDAQVIMTNANPAYQIRYTTDGTIPTATSTLYTAPIPYAFTGPTERVILAKVFDGSTAIGQTTRTAIVNVVASPTVAFTGQHAVSQSYWWASDVVVTASSEYPGAEIRYTLDGSVPNASSTLYTGPVTLPFGSGSISGYQSAVVPRFIAIYNGAVSQDTYDYVTFVVDVNEPAWQATTESGDAFVAALTSPSSSCTMRYTLDGSAPSPSSPSGQVTLPWSSSNASIRAAVFHPSGLQSAPRSTTVKFIVQPPVVTPQTKTSAEPSTFNLQALSAFASILYTTDGSTPTPSSPSTTNPGAVTLEPGQTLKACTVRNGVFSQPITARLLAPSKVVKTITLSHASSFYHFYETRQDLVPDEAFTEVATPCSPPASSTQRWSPRFLASNPVQVTITPSTSNQVFKFVRLPSLVQSTFQSPTPLTAAPFLAEFPQEDTLFFVSSNQSFQVTHATLPTSLIPAFFFEAEATQSPTADSEYTFDLLDPAPSSRTVVSSSSTTYRIRLPHKIVSHQYAPTFTLKPHNVQVTLRPDGLLVDSTLYPASPTYDILHTVPIPTTENPSVLNPPPHLPLSIQATVQGSFTEPAFTNPVIHAGKVLNIQYPKTSLNPPPNSTSVILLDPTTQSIILQPPSFIPTSALILGIIHTTSHITKYYSLLSSSLIRVRQQSSSLQGGSILSIGSNLTLNQDHVSSTNHDHYPSDLSFKFPNPLKSKITIPVSIQSR